KIGGRRGDRRADQEHARSLGLHTHSPSPALASPAVRPHAIVGPARRKREVLLSERIPGLRTAGRWHFRLLGASEGGTPRLAAGKRRLEAIADLVGPEALQATERPVDAPEILRRHLAHGFHGAELAAVEPLHDLARLRPFGRQADPHGAAILV